ncbi:hypothetical protein [Xenorhabdus sp. IM139775]|uniref:hypothetical protein n=1 Tax=Xenorhabdus sp. IM139775 TaxID=3025876 RepID=UPI002358F811|nr:hypothetical protein [Xenorhabdus sp. IM139775]MDC9594975.1 hypothetical protein [Xenorhabdus sp. IM139775]
MSQIKQSVKVSPPLAKSNGQGLAALSLIDTGRNFASVPAIALSMVVQAGET